MEQVRVLVSGRVQGVWYRASTAARAQSLNLVGWVRNLPSGEVEITAQGSREALEALIAWCHLGPPAAQVEAVTLRWQESCDTFDAFLVRR